MIGSISLVAKERFALDLPRNRRSGADDTPAYFSQNVRAAGILDDCRKHALKKAVQALRLTGSHQVTNFTARIESHHRARGWRQRLPICANPIDGVSRWAWRGVQLSL
ncbi:hypothetical protein QZN06_22390 [Burkholderia multivorans]|nr:hypothetical protein [Burkholderia multivorans]MDN8011335.1 hypothetical protein [Burkholderia multivorans]